MTRGEPVRIGLDFDNTIVSYDVLFHKVAREAGEIPADLAVSKLAVRDHLRRIGREEVWTAMQGEVYGSRLLEADPFPGVVEFIAWARRIGIELFIVSHKTKHPFLGPQYDLHKIAREWIHVRLSDGEGSLLKDGNVFFELTKEEKVARIGACGCDYFIDDLPEILTAPGFPAATVPVLFAPEGSDAALPLVMSNWRQIRDFTASL